MLIIIAIETTLVIKCVSCGCQQREDKEDDDEYEFQIRPKVGQIGSKWGKTGALQIIFQ